MFNLVFEERNIDKPRYEKKIYLKSITDYVINDTLHVKRF